MEFELFAIKQYKDNTEKPYNMGNELGDVKVNTYIIVGDKDILFPYKKSVLNARRQLGAFLKKETVLQNVGHGIETYDKAIKEIDRIIKTYTGEKVLDTL